MWASCCMGQTAGVATGTWMGTEPSIATAWTSSRSPPRAAWATCGRSECGTTTKVWGGRCRCAPVPASTLSPHLILPSTGLSPAWFLQHVIVRDLQNGRSTFFLVNDWLSVETEANGGLVEKEVLAAGEAAAARGWVGPREPFCSPAVSSPR